MASNWCNTEWTSRLPNWPDDVPVHHVEAKAGDCILFTEKLSTAPFPGLGKMSGGRFSINMCLLGCTTVMRVMIQPIPNSLNANDEFWNFPLLV